MMASILSMRYISWQSIKATNENMCDEDGEYGMEVEHIFETLSCRITSAPKNRFVHLSANG